MSQKQPLFGIEIDAVRMSDAVQKVRKWAFEDGESDRCRFVVTPNVDHTVLLSENEQFQLAYENADMVLADGHPIVWASKLLRRPLPNAFPAPN